MPSARQNEEFDPEAFLQKKLEEIPGTDILILSMGGILGFNGYTPLTALINLFSPGGQVRQFFDISTGAIGPGVGPGISLLGNPTVVGLLLSLFLPAETRTQPLEARGQEYQARFLNAMIGSLEAYALTRPGVVTGLATAIGELVPL